MAGVVLADVSAPPSTPLLVASSTLAIGCLIPWRGRVFVLGLMFILLGATNLALRTAVISPLDLRRLVEDRIEDATLRGTLCRVPLPKTYEQNGEEVWRTVAELEVRSIRFHREGAVWQPAFGRVTISTPGTLSLSFFSGQELDVSGQLRQPRPALAEGLFDYRSHLHRRGIYYQLQAASADAWQVAPSNDSYNPALTDRFIAWGKTALERGLPVEDESLRLEWALTLGWKTALNDEVSEPFIRAATYHIFAVDGLRIAIISSIFLSLFRVLGLSRATSGLIVIPLIWLYAGMTGFPASAIRATVMASVIIIGWTLRRPSDFINSLFAAALIILLWEPSQLFQAGFQLSFLVVLCIILVMPALERLGAPMFKADPWLPDNLRPRWQKWLRRAGRYVWDILLVSTAAWLGSIPLTAYYFNIFTPVSGPANLLAVPLCGLVLICNLISLLLAGWFPWAAEFYNHAGWFLMEGIRVSSHWFERWPAAYFYVPAPALATTCLYYLLLLTLATGWAFKIRHRAWVLSGLALLTGAWGLHALLDRPTVCLTVLPLKGAAALFVDAPGRENDLLINCGNESSAGLVTKPFLRAQGVNRLSHLLLTHGDLYQVGGAPIIQEDFHTAQVHLGPLRFRSPAYRSVCQHLESEPGLVKVVQRGARIGPWEVLHPASGDNFPQADDKALVLRGEVRGTRVLLLSTLGKPGQSALAGRESDLRADIVVAGIPKQTEPLAEALLDSIQPKLIIISDAEHPAAARANRKLQERLARRRVPVLYTAQAGAITLLVHGKGWEIRTAMPPPANSVALATPGITEDESQ